MVSNTWDMINMPGGGQRQTFLDKQEEVVSGMIREKITGN